MKIKSIVSACVFVLATAGLVSPGTALAKERVVFSGGPAGGTFQVVANAMQVYKPMKASKDFKVRAQSSAGSVENLRKVNSGKAQMGVVYSGHVFLGRNGQMKNDPKKYEDVMAVAWLYGAPGQLFANCELFFTHMGVWDKIERNAMGYNDAAQAFGNKQLDAFWLFTAFPSGAVIMAAQTNDIELIDLGKDAESSGFYDQYPYFSKITVPADTYRGVDYASNSFQDSALWVANSKVTDDTVYKMLSMIYTDEGLAHMKEQKKTFKLMSLDTGTQGVVTPWHPGAVKFWKEKGMM
jgi:TRAP-type uncharacterized transport system substrate-binding protein